MGGQAHTLDSFDALRSDPIRWLLSQLVTYVIALTLTGIIFVVGIGAYTYLVGPPIVIDVPPLPSKKPLVAPPQSEPASQDAGMLISRLQGKEIGVPVYHAGAPYGFVVEVKVEPSGTPRLLVIQTINDALDGTPPPTIEVPYDSVRWHSEKQAEHDWSVN